MEKLYATFDFGSHSSIMCISSFAKNCLSTRLEKISHPNLASQLHQNGAISDESIEQLKATLKEFTLAMARVGARPLAAGGTHPFREASNGSDAMALISSELGIQGEILSTEREAALVRTALEHQFPGAISLLDIGGGSTEVSTPKKFHSIPFGAVNLFEQFGAHPDQGNRQKLKRAIKKFPLKLGIENTIAIGGTATTLAAISKGQVFDPEIIDGTVITTEEVTQWIERLADLKPEYRAKVPGLPLSRVDYIMPGLCILEAFLARYSVPQFTVSTWGLRQGLALEALKSAAGNPVPA